MGAEQGLCLLLGGFVIVLGVALVFQVRPGPTSWAFTLSWTCAGIAFGLWPPQTCMALDHVTGIAGLGLLVWSCATTLCIIFTITLQVHLAGRWRWWRRATPALAAGVVVLYSALWLWVHVRAGPLVAHLLYDGYHGDQTALLTWNLTFGLCSIAVNLLALRAQLFTPRRQWFDRALVTTFGAGALYSLLLVGQTLASAIGLGSTAVVPFLHAIRLTAIVLVTLVTLWIAIVADLWAAAGLWRQTRRLRRDRDHLMNLVVVISDRLVWRYAPEQIAPLERLARAWAIAPPAGLAAAQARLALQAARRITWRRGELIGHSWATASPLERQAAHQSIAEEAALDIATDTAPMADIGHIVRVLLSGIRLPDWLAAPLPPPDDWHVRAAAALAPYLHLGVSSPAIPAGSRVSIPAPAAVPWYRRPAHALQTWYRHIAAEHTRAKTDLIVCCELIEDYLTQLDVPDDHDLTVRVAVLADTWALTPFEYEIAARSAHIVSLFGLDNIRLTPPSRGVVARVPAPFRKASSPLLAEMKISLWHTVAAVITTALPATELPPEAQAAHDLRPPARRIASLIVEAARTL